MIVLIKQPNRLTASRRTATYLAGAAPTFLRFTQGDRDAVLSASTG